MDISVLIPATIAGIILLACGASSFLLYTKEENVVALGEIAVFIQATAAIFAAIGFWLLYAIYMSASFPSSH